MIRKAALPALALVLALGAGRAFADERLLIDYDRKTCAARDPAKAIASCTRVIQDRDAPRDVHALALQNRGFAYQ